MSSTAGVYKLRPRHALMLEELANDPGIGPRLAGGTAAFVEAVVAEREAGTAFAFVIEDEGKLVGLCRLHGVGGGVAKGVELWVGPAFRQRGYATFGVKMVLEFAFRNLSLAEVRTEARGSEAGALERNGFQPARPAGETGEYAITKERWRDFLDGPALAKLHPALKAILDAEQAAGNEVVETGVGWPEEGSVFVRLREPFRVERPGLPEGVRFSRIDDPHWWTAEYTTERPRHILAY